MPRRDLHLHQIKKPIAARRYINASHARRKPNLHRRSLPALSSSASLVLLPTAMVSSLTPRPRKLASRQAAKLALINIGDGTFAGLTTNPASDAGTGKWIGINAAGIW